ncbi:early nodulin-93 [Carica papaya]|uniref:early nodulin-93 n=1 Tax=Carica papaya TaxID=3649 RepID=UPI000B8D0FFF|nr:early nodulin-93 [Carica papaya]XP_021907600.1 early nodulin-93 [Carica papaya]
MGIPSGMRDFWVHSRNNSLLIASPSEKDLRAQQAAQDSAVAGAKAASLAAVVAAVPTLVAVRVIPWAKANINHTGQALIVSAASIAAFFIAADKNILQTAKTKTETKLKEAA